MRDYRRQLCPFQAVHGKPLPSCLLIILLVGTGTVTLNSTAEHEVRQPFHAVPCTW